MKINQRVARASYSVIALLIAALPLAAHAALPSTLSYQGFLTAAGGAPIDSTVSITFRLYTTPSGGSLVWEETQTVSVEQGLFSVELGSITPLDPADFDNPLYLGLAVDADPEMTPRRMLSLTGYAIKAGDAETLTGITAGGLDQSLHVGDLSNPHNVTAAQSGAATPSDIATHQADAAAHHAKTMSFGELLDQVLDAQIPATITRDSELNAHAAISSAHHSRYTDPEAVNAIKAADGPGSGLNADLLDGLTATQFATLTGTQNFDSGTLYIDSASNEVGIGTTSPGIRLAVAGSGSPNGLRLGDGQPAPVTLYHTSSGLRVLSTTSRIQFGSVEYLQDCGGNCIELGGNVSATGNVETTGQFTYASPKTHNWSASGNVVTGASSAISEVSSGYFFVGTTTGQVQANIPVHLPQGAIPTQFRIYYYDNDSDDGWDIFARLYRYTLGTTSVGTVASITQPTAGASTAVQSSVVNATLTDAIDNGQHAYAVNLVINLTGASTSLRFYAAQVTYTLDTLQP